ncbi:MAG: glutathione S-transferase N-terminal domain-containing protein [Pseudomonadota bacterium]|nr:glutathione S-transferase N-terminal domain-containing protein [Pseudomonadota bacterium]MDQ3160573.1 glutathione S-transferase N-terminal domain-containing protein [Pseudomonadota bacterium]
MKLYTKPGACSTADHIALQWTGQPFDVEVMDAKSMKEPAYLAVNPAGAVPAITDIAADGGQFVLTQNAAILGYIADMSPSANLTGDGSAHQRAIATKWLAFCNSDLHPAFSPLFGPGMFSEDATHHDAIKAAARKRILKLFETADDALKGKQWLAGFRSIADPYFYITIRWADAMKFDLSDFANVVAFKHRMEADPGVRAALKAEGLSA